ncbi:YqgE/AlgH family protein [Spartobacteria bacterium LR76]|nr:YqgE/AlgH family protein [Spartobacteria bacterium LR76]
MQRAHLSANRSGAIVDSMAYDGSAPANLTGSLLIAHPSLTDPNFRRTILFLSHHSAEDGAVGLVLNRPLRKTLGEIAASKVPFALQQAETFYGGPVAMDQVTVANIEWQENPSSVVFHSYTGLEEIEIGNGWLPSLRVFLGYAGWTAGQLEGEIEQKAWIIMPPTRDLIEMASPDDAWRGIMRASSPSLKLLSEAPDHPEWN